MMNISLINITLSSTLSFPKQFWIGNAFFSKDGKKKAYLSPSQR